MQIGYPGGGGGILIFSYNTCICIIFIFIIIIIIIFWGAGGGGVRKFNICGEGGFCGYFFWLISMHLQGFS